LHKKGFLTPVLLLGVKEKAPGVNGGRSFVKRSTGTDGKSLSAPLCLPSKVDSFKCPVLGQRHLFRYSKRKRCGGEALRAPHSITSSAATCNVNGASGFE
jgi:hypothetical protein